SRSGRRRPRARAPLPRSPPARSRRQAAPRSSTSSPPLPSPVSRLPALLVCPNPVLHEQRPTDLVETVEQHLPTVGLHGERGAEPEAVVHALLLEVDRELVLTARRLMAPEQLADLLGQETHRDEPILTAVGVKDVRERRCENRTEAVLAERPHRVLARRAAAEILPREQDARAPSDGMVELEVRIRAAVGPESPVVEQGRPEPGALDPPQELLRHDLVGVHVGAGQGRHPTGVTHEGLHHDAGDRRTSTCRPAAVRAAARGSSIRALVQDPRNTRSIGSPSSGVPGVSPMYSSARVTARRSASVGKSAGLGTRPVTDVTMPGLVPQVTWGATSEASSSTCVSYVAPGSVRSSRHLATARSHAAPLGARGRPARYATVFSSGAIMPARAPASIDMLHTVIR